MQAPKKIKRGDAFARAISEAFGESATLAKIEQSRKLYARYRTDDVLDRLKNEASDKNGKPQPWD